MRNALKSVRAIAATLITFGALAGGTEADPVTFAYAGTVPGESG